MKLAFCIFNYFPYGGLERDCLKIIELCQQHGHQIDLYTMRYKGKKPKSVKVIEIPISGLSNHRRCLSFSRNCLKQLKQQHYDLTIGFNRMPGLDFYYAGDVCFAAEKAGKFFGLYRLTKRYRAYRFLEQSVFAPQSHCQILALAQKQIDDYQHCYHTPASRFHLLPPGIDQRFMVGENHSHLRQKYHSEFKLEQKNLLLTLGSSFKRKGLDRSIMGLSNLPADIKKKTLLWVIGNDQNKYFVKLARQLNVAEQVKFLGAQDDVLPFLLAADVLLHPAYSENTGQAILEALVTGLPVLTTANCGFAEHVTSSQGGIVLPQPFRQRDFNTALQQLLSDTSLRAQSAQNALDYGHRVDLYSGKEKIIEIIARQT
ncbi:MAG: glycosyltransferase family 4 protein [Pseudomonadota bacterium]